MLTETYENVFTNYGLTTSRVTNVITTAVTEYGCWCVVPPFTGKGRGNRPLNYLDELCKVYSECNKPCTDGFTVDYEIVLRAGLHNCTSKSTCGLNTCECISTFVLATARYLDDNDAAIFTAITQLRNNTLQKTSYSCISREEPYNFELE